MLKKADETGSLTRAHASDGAANVTTTVHIYMSQSITRARIRDADDTLRKLKPAGRSARLRLSLTCCGYELHCPRPTW
jgi:hypothetical protein